MLKKKICGILAAMMVATTVLSGKEISTNASTLNNVDIVTRATANIPSTPEDTETPEDNTDNSIVLENGTYKIANKTLKENKEDESSIRKYVETESIVKVKDGKITLTMKYTDEAVVDTIKSTNYVSINGEKVEFTKNDDGSITFEIESLAIVQSKIVVNLTYTHPDLPEAYFPGKMHTVSIDLVHEGEFVKVEESGSEDIEEDVLENGDYKIINIALKSGGDKESSIRSYIKPESIVTVNEGKITLTMQYTEEAVESIIKETHYVSVNGEKVEFRKNDDGSISFEIESIDSLYSRIDVNLTYTHPNLPEAYFPGKMHTVSIDLLHEGELTKIEDDITVGTPDNDNSGDVGNGDIDGSTGASQNGQHGSGEGAGSESGTDSESGKVEAEKIYKGKNEIVSDSDIGRDMARDAISEDIKIEKIGEKYLATITFTEFGKQQMSDFIVSVNGKEVATKELGTDLSGLSFELDSLDDSIEISTKINAMGGRRISFGIKVLQDTLVEIENSNEGTTDDTTGGTTEGTTGGTTQGGETSGTIGGATQGGETSGTTEETKKEEEPQVMVGKLYSIQNNVTHENETGVAMARMYLSSTSKVEEVEGQYYVTLTFTGAEFMQNHEIYVNGSKVSVSKSTSGDETYVRFAVGSLNDSIKVKMYVVPMKRDVEFGVELLTDTLTFIKEYTIETLPNTGAATSSAVVAGLGLLMTSAGVVLAKKRK